MQFDYISKPLTWSWCAKYCVIETRFIYVRSLETTVKDSEGCGAWKLIG